MKNDTAKLEKILEGKQNEEEQWKDEKHWLNKDLLEKEKERKTIVIVINITMYNISQSKELLFEYSFDGISSIDINPSFSN